MPATATIDTDTGDTTTVNVSLLGSDTVAVTVEGTGTVADVLQLAAEKLGVSVNTDKVAIVQDGVQVEPDTPAQQGATVTGTTNLRNGITA